MIAGRIHQLAVFVVMALILVPQRVAGQASSSEMAGFPMPPPGGYVATKTFGYVGDYGYYTAPTSSAPGMSANASDYRYVRYRGVSGKRVYVYGAWGPTSIPPASGGGDSCFHAHASYGVWARWEFKIEPFFTFSGWSFLSGGGMSGVRNPNGKCVFATENDLTDIDSRFGWGTTFKSYNFGSFVTDIVVGALSNTHGWGSCSVSSGSFVACHEPSYIIGYTLP